MPEDTTGTVEDNRPNSQKDLELRLAAGHDPKKFAAAAAAADTEAQAVSYAVEGNDTSGYIGVSPEYATYANDTEKPLQAEEGVESDLEDNLTQPTRVNKITQEVANRQIEGVGSTDPLIYSETSGSVFETQEVKADKAPTKVEELSSLSTSTSERDGAVETDAVKPASAPTSQAAPQGADTPGKTGNTPQPNAAPVPQTPPAS